MNGRERVLLLNPPGRKLYLRDYYCSKVSQASYIHPPLDLLFQSGWLYEAFDVTVIDAIVEGKDLAAVAEAVRGGGFKGIIMLVGSVSWDEDRTTLRALRAVTDAFICASGDILRSKTADRLREAPEIDAALLDFTAPDAVRYLQGERNGLDALFFRDGGGVAAPAVRRGGYDVPVPRHELFIGKPYRHPFASRLPFTAVLTDYGCPFKCTFCIMTTLGFAYRSADNVMAELRHVRASGGKELFWADQTFGVRKDRNVEICRRMIDERLDLGWFTFSRVDVMTRELLTLMREAGCHTIIFGVESGNQAILDTYRKEYTLQQIRDAFDWCDELGITTVGTFILGLPEETAATCRETIDFAKSLKCDYASFNVAVPRVGTDLREKAVAGGVTDDSTLLMDQSGTSAAMRTLHLTQAEVEAFKKAAVREFYLRPSYLLRRLRTLRSPRHLIMQLRSARALLRNFL